MIALKIITLVLQLIIAGMAGIAIGACIDSNKKYNKIFNLLINLNEHCKNVINHSEEVINMNKKILSFNESHIDELDKNINFIKENMVRRKNPIKD